MTDRDRKGAWHGAKSAIRSYAKDPTALNAQEVEEVWKEIRRMETVSPRRASPAKTSAADKSSGPSGKTR